jgi:hypothetical protein
MITENPWVATNLTQGQKNAIKMLLLSLEKVYPAATFISDTAKSDKPERVVKITQGVHGGLPNFWITVDVQVDKYTSLKTCHIYVNNNPPNDAWIFLMNPGPGANGKAVSVEDKLREGIDWI